MYMYVYYCVLYCVILWVCSQIHYWFLVLFNSLQWRNWFGTARTYFDCWSPWLYSVPSVPRKDMKRQMPETSYLQGTNISHLRKRKVIFKSTFFKGDMLVPRMPVLQVNNYVHRWNGYNPPNSFSQDLRLNGPFWSCSYFVVLHNAVLLGLFFCQICMLSWASHENACFFKVSPNRNWPTILLAFFGTHQDAFKVMPGLRSPVELARSFPLPSPTEAFCEYQSCWSSSNFTSSGQGWSQAERQQGFLLSFRAARTMKHFAPKTRGFYRVLLLYGSEMLIWFGVFL